VNYPSEIHIDSSRGFGSEAEVSTASLDASPRNGLHPYTYPFSNKLAHSRVDGPGYNLQ
jgi:hypothetical protein